MRILILGATGMLGSAVFKSLSQDPEQEVWGTMRRMAYARFFSGTARERLICDIDVLDADALATVLARTRPDVVINCVGLIKQIEASKDPLAILPINALFPHRLCKLCDLIHARLIHVSTDCVFSGKKGGYTEEDVSDAEDLYGKSKYIGELHDLPHAITLRTSIIGHELATKNALIEWFLSQDGKVKGFAKAIFSGLPTVEFARVIKDFVLPCPELHGLYHVAAQPISKLELLRIVAGRYGKVIEILPDDSVVIDRSLNAECFRRATGYVAPGWPELVKRMHDAR